MLATNRRQSVRQKSHNYDLRRRVLMKNFLQTQGGASTSNISQGNKSRHISKNTLQCGPQRRGRVIISYPKFINCKCMNPVETRDAAVQTVDLFENKENISPNKSACKCQEKHIPINYTKFNFTEANCNFSRRLRTTESGMLREPIIVRNRNLTQIESRLNLESSVHHYSNKLNSNGVTNVLRSEENSNVLVAKKVFKTPSLRLKQSLMPLRKRCSPKLDRTNSHITHLKRLSEHSLSIKRKCQTRRRTSLRSVFQQILSSQSASSNDIFSSSSQVPSLKNSRNQSFISKLFKIGKKQHISENEVQDLSSQQDASPRRPATILRSRSLHEQTRPTPPVLRNRKKRSHSVRIAGTKIGFN